jgi:alanine racemase
MGRPTRAEIDLEAVVYNTTQIRRLIGSKRKLMAVVKADGYGHGAIHISRACLRGGADWLGVALPEEGAELRNAGFEVPILVLALSGVEQADTILQNNLSQVICTEEMARALDRSAMRHGKKARVHIKIDTGMGRIGISPGETIPFIKKILDLPHLELEGIYTHLSVADSPDPSFTINQFQIFSYLCKEIEKEGIKIPLRHMANSAAIVRFPEMHLDMVRPGIMIYGVDPFPDGNGVIELKPVMTFKTEIVFIKSIPKGTSISYGRTFISERPMRVATICVGYADGYPRHLSNKGEVLVRGKRSRILGNVCMDMVIIDITHIPEAREGDEVVLFGNQLGGKLLVEEVATWAGSIPYEILCGISRRVPRVYIEGNKGGEKD